jgi:hypothetical protein
LLAVGSTLWWASVLGLRRRVLLLLLVLAGRGSPSIASIGLILLLPRRLLSLGRAAVVVLVLVLSLRRLLAPILSLRRLLLSVVALLLAVWRLLATWRTLAGGRGWTARISRLLRVATGRGLSVIGLLRVHCRCADEMMRESCRWEEKEDTFWRGRSVRWCTLDEIVNELHLRLKGGLLLLV